jgi:hypothetical protein
LDAKEKLKIMFKEGDNTIKGCGMDQLDESGEELCLKQIYVLPKPLTNLELP